MINQYLGLTCLGRVWSRFGLIIVSPFSLLPLFTIFFMLIVFCVESYCLLRHGLGLLFTIIVLPSIMLSPPPSCRLWNAFKKAAWYISQTVYSGKYGARAWATLQLYRAVQFEKEVESIQACSTRKQIWMNEWINGSVVLYTLHCTLYALHFTLYTYSSGKGSTDGWRLPPSPITTYPNHQS